MSQTQFRSDRCQTCGRRKKRTTDANARLWALYAKMADKAWPHPTDNDVIVRYSPQSFHLYYKLKLLGADDVKLPNGKTMIIPHSTADLSVDEFGEYLDAVQADAAERGVYLDD